MKILAIGAHFDDIELSCGGFLAKLIKRGHRVYILITTESSYTDYNGKVLRDKFTAYKEGYKALKILGIKEKNIKCLNFKTKYFPYSGESIEAINRYIDECKPDLILCPHVQAESHNDHWYTAKATLAASRYYKNIWMYEAIYPSKLAYIPFKPIIYVDITDTLGIKIKALKAHKSQWKKYPEWNDLIISLARIRGIEDANDKSEYSEAFEPIKMSWGI